MQRPQREKLRRELGGWWENYYGRLNYYQNCKLQNADRKLKKRRADRCCAIGVFSSGVVLRDGRWHKRKDINLISWRSHMRTLRLVALLSVLALVATAGLGQAPFGAPFGRGGNSAMLLKQESVQKELKLNGDQIRKLEEVSENMRDKSRELFGLEEPQRSKMSQE